MSLSACRTVCATCGEIVHEGPVEIGRKKMSKHLEANHPEQFRAMRKQAEKSKGRRKGGNRNGFLFPDRQAKVWVG